MSPIDSPRESCSSSPRRTIGVAPSSATPTSKEIRVRVEGFSKTRPMLRPARASAPRRARRPAFSSSASSSSPPSSNAPSSSPVRKSRFKPRILSGCSSPPSPGTSSTGAISRPTPSSSPGARGCSGSASATPPTSRSTASSSTSSPRCSPAPSWDVALLQETPAPLRRPAGRGLRRPKAHRVLTSRNGLGALRARGRPPQPGPDRLRRGRLQPDPGAARRSARRDRRAARAGDPRGPARSAGRWR